ncbi:MAG: dethiobiotin synthetase [Maribacter sp.]|jgi:dethiobiotin synthetase
MKTYFVTGISTEVGKTIASALLVEAMQADYWKPIQSGDLHYSDSDKIRELISNQKTIIHPERFRLNTPASPHYSAEVDGVEISLNDFKIPHTNNHLIIEGAGGLLVPINDKDTVLDVIQQFNIPVILVANYYLGSINHTLSSIRLLQQLNIPIHTLIFMGKPNIASRDIIKKMSHGVINHYVEIPHLEEINAGSILNQVRLVNLF